MIPAGDLPKPGESVTVRWPNGDYDFVLEFEYAEPGAEGWILLTGVVLEPQGVAQGRRRSLYVKPTTDGEFTLRPKIG